MSRRFKIVDDVLVDVIDVNVAIVPFDSDEEMIEADEILVVCDQDKEEFEAMAMEWVENAIKYGAISFELCDNEDGGLIDIINVKAGDRIITIVEALWDAIVEFA